MTTLTLVPVEYTKAPDGTLHLIRQDPDAYDTLCGLTIRTKPGRPGWTIGDETQSGCSATCLPCRRALRLAQRGADALGNVNAREGLDVCGCGCKYWENDQCFDCGAQWHPSFRGEDDA